MKNAKEICFAFHYRFLFFLPFLYLPLIARSQDSLIQNKKNTIQIKGFIKDMQSVSFTNNSQSLVTGNFIHNRVNFRWNILNNLHIRMEARNRLFYGEQVKSTFQFGKYIADDKGFFKLSHNIVDNGAVVLNTTLDRVLLNWSKNKTDVTLGRQRINWGINLVWNPNDIFNTFNYFDFDYEERPGCDAARIQYTTNTFSSFEIAYKPGKKTKQQVGAVMYKTNFRKYDLQEFAGIYLEDIVIGTGWAGNLKQTGFKGEGSYFHSYKTKKDSAAVFTTSISLDRTFKNDYFVMVSYLYNSKGSDVVYGAANFTTITLSAKNLMPFDHTVFIQLSKSFNPLVSGAFSTMFSPAKNTWILLPSVSLSINDSWDLSLITQSFFADVNNAYRTLGNAIYLRIRWSY